MASQRPSGSRRPRPWGVTLAGGLAIAYAVAGLAVGLFLVSAGGVAAGIAFLTILLNVWFLAIALALLALGSVFALTGVFTLRGHAWARWSLVAVYAFTAWIGLIATPFWMTACGGVNAVAAVLLVEPRARQWFAHASGTGA